MAESKSYDIKCEELARAFLDEEPATTEAAVCQLASEIQQTIEDYIATMRDE